MEEVRPRLILVPTDFSAPAARALRYASSLAGRFDAHLLVVHVDAFIPPIDFTVAPAQAFTIAQEAQIADAREELQHHAEANIGCDVPYDLRVGVGEPEERIPRIAEECGCDLVVMGTHGRTGVRRLVFGSVTEAVMRLAPIPVVTIGAAEAEPKLPSRIISLFDRSEASREALLHAAGFAEATAPLLLIATSGADTTTPGDLLRLRGFVPPALVDRCELKLIPVRSAAMQIVALASAAGADLIALGLQPERGLAGTLVGTTADQVVQHSSCPVLTVNAKAARRRRADGTDPRDGPLAVLIVRIGCS